MRCCLVARCFYAFNWSWTSILHFCIICSFLVLSDDFNPYICNGSCQIVLYLVICIAVSKLGYKLVLIWEVFRDLVSPCLSDLAIYFYREAMLSATTYNFLHPEPWGLKLREKEPHCFLPHWLFLLLPESSTWSWEYQWEGRSHNRNLNR